MARVSRDSPDSSGSHAQTRGDESVLRFLFHQSRNRISYIFRLSLLFFHIAAPFTLNPGVSTPNFSTRLRRLKELLDEAMFGVACVVCWNIWNFRNGWLHDKIRGKRETLVARSKNFLESFKSARFNFPLNPVSNGVAGWQPPLCPFIKLNFDAAVYESDVYQIAAVARDFNGKCLRWQVQKL